MKQILQEEAPPTGTIKAIKALEIFLNYTQQPVVFSHVGVSALILTLVDVAVIDKKSEECEDSMAL